MTYSFHPEAEREFIRAIDYYEERQQELGYEFSMEVHSARSCPSQIMAVH